MHPRRRGVSCRTDEGIDLEFLPLRLVSVGLTGTYSGSIVKAAGTILTCLLAWRRRARSFISDRGLLFSGAEHGADLMVTVHSHLSVDEGVAVREVPRTRHNSEGGLHHTCHADGELDSLPKRDPIRDHLRRRDGASVERCPRDISRRGLALVLAPPRRQML